MATVQASSATLAQKPPTPPMFSSSAASSASTSVSTCSTSASPRRQQQPSASGAAASTIAPHAHAATRQIRPPKSPLYVPAVLRPTERPASRRTTGSGAGPTSAPHALSAPPSPPRSQHSSSDSLSAQQHQSSATPPALQLSTHMQALARSTTHSSSASSTLTAPPSPTTPAPIAQLPAAAGPQPTRAHWKPNAQATVCDAAYCDAVFSLLLRRHHCRRCGGVFCGPHSAHQVPLDQHAEFDPRAGAWSRACQACAAHFALRCQGQAQRDADADSDTMPVPVTAAAARPGAVAAGSVGKDWTWSTF